MLRPSIILVSSLLAVPSVWAEDAAPTTPASMSAPAAPVESEAQQFARAQLMNMAKYLSGTEKFSVTLRAGYDVVQDNGQKIEFGEIRDIVVQRPNQVRIEQRAGSGGRDLMLFDGQNITMLDGDSGVYAQTDQPGDIDATVIHFVRDLKMRLPLAPLFMAHFPEELQRRVESIEYVEETDILGEPAHHIAARTANVDFQVWIAAGKQPLPLRVVMTYREAEGQPQFWASFSKWNLSPSLAKATFTFHPAADAKQIAFAAQIPAMSNGPQVGAMQEQGDKP